jgi:ribosomal protein L37E
MITNCKDCGGKVSTEAAACPHCGCPNVRNETEQQQAMRRLLTSGNCPVCRTGNLVRMDAGSRGTAFGQGNLLGAFIKSHRCNRCGYLA